MLFFSAQSVNIIKDVALVYRVRLDWSRHSVQKLHGKAGKNSLGGKEKKDCDVRPSVSTDFGGYKEPLFSAAPGKHKRAAQCSGVIGRRGLVQWGRQEKRTYELFCLANLLWACIQRDYSFLQQDVVVLDALVSSLMLICSSLVSTVVNMYIFVILGLSWN